ncbi:hypothetical protein [Belnapia rosea]|uniref:Apolipoprotein A1/A4/E domain-containing protein n=1 Tax=Belnapia rosea TaxID=938405 RepID=A0A1G6VTZ7_9PROT|nr:hypothetical protein [Belnapia rosea]SDD56305.1 hypothetical protein SAMN04487779_1009154 [Belnapia rosea]
MSIMQAIAPVVSNPITVYGVVAALFAWAGWSAVRLAQAATRVRLSLESAAARLTSTDNAVAFAGNYETLSDQFGASEWVGPRWREYRDSLVIPPTIGRPIRATARPDGWFDAGQMLRGAGVDLRYHAALPNLLVGAGLLFTFLGLAAALASAGGIVAEGATQQARNGALKALLDAASFKFVTSLAGLFLSIAYALFRKQVLARAEAACDRFVGLLEERIPLLTPAALQQEANALLERQGNQLESFSTELAINIAGAFDRAFDQRLGEHIGPLSEAMQRLAGGMSSRNEDAMQRMLDAFLERLQGGTGDRMNEVAESLSGLGARLEGLQTGLGDAAVRMAQSADAMATRMGEGAEAALQRITDQMGSLAETLRGVADQARNTGADAGQALAQRIEAAAGSFEAAARNVAETLSAAAAGLERRMGDEASASTGRLAAQFEAMLAELRGLAETSRSTGTAAFETLAERIAAAAGGFEASAAQVAKTLSEAAAATGGSLGRGAEDAVQRIAAATEGMRSEMQAMLAELRASMASAGDAVRDSAQQGGDRLRGSMEAAGTTLADAITNAAGGLQQAGEAAGGALRDGGQAAGQRLTDAGGALGSRAEGLAVQLRGLGEAADGLRARIAELDVTTRAAATPLATGAADMKAAAASVQAALQPLGRTAEALRGAVEQLGGVALKLQDAQAATSRLVEGVNLATGRFEGVDRALAGTLDALQQGLQGFTQQIRTFVVQTDGNLAQAATQLGNLTKELESTLGDFLDQMKRK